tara:strand:+ start:2281 stop:2457 length:177 start_codon:yes stop_codon:yes gene_type:complete
LQDIIARTETAIKGSRKDVKEGKNGKQELNLAQNEDESKSLQDLTLLSELLEVTLSSS